MILELPLNVTAATLSTYIAPPLSCNKRKKETREKLERYSKEEEKKIFKIKKTIQILI